MNFFSLIRIEAKKLRRSKILWILAAAAFLLWLPSVLNAHLNFEMQAEGISPEHNFLIQGLLGMSWFLFPAGMVVSTVLLNLTEETNHGILKMLALPIRPALLCLAKFVILAVLAAILILISVGMYFAGGAIASYTQDYPLLLPPLFVLREAGLIYLAAIPMLSIFWLLSVCIRTPIFSIGVGLASIVPSVLIISTKAWFVYPCSYPLFVITAEYGKLAANLNTAPVELVPWLPVAAGITVLCLFISCLRFGRSR
ncbi:ABC transporter permease [Schaedlerella arabinosiphila]|uniref:ABC transporter permease n=1 Tax=Schaedlerella arabinosiphila TaxID=2044587 RepID=UPI002557F67D|nr:ABC transporter permease [Schaedlerella arabinosiphila]